MLHCRTMFHIPQNKLHHTGCQCCICKWTKPAQMFAPWINYTVRFWPCCWTLGQQNWSWCSRSTKITVHYVDTGGFISVLCVRVLHLACAKGRVRKHSGTKNTKDVSWVSFWTTLREREGSSLFSPIFSLSWSKDSNPVIYRIFSIQKSHGNCSRGFPPRSCGHESTAAHSAGQRYLQFLIICQVQLQQELKSLSSAQHSGRLGMLYSMPNLHNYQIFAWSCKLAITKCHLWTGTVTGAQLVSEILALFQHHAKSLNVT